MSLSQSTKSGIYRITCVPTGRFYVGSAVNFKNRWKLHRGALNRGKHHSKYFQYAWNKYGSDSFKWEVLEYVEPARLIEREQHHIDLLDATKNGFNVCPMAGSCLGTKRSEEAKAKMAEAARNRSPEIRAKIAEANRGGKRPETAKANRTREWTEESKAKSAESSRGRKHTAETCNKIAKANREREWTDESKTKLSISKRNPSEEFRAIIAEANRHRHWTGEMRARLATANRGRKHTAEAKAKMSLIKRNPSPETRAKLSAASSGRKHSAETRAKMSNDRRGKPRRKQPLTDQVEFGF